MDRRDFSKLVGTGSLLLPSLTATAAQSPSTQPKYVPDYSSTSPFPVGDKAQLFIDRVLVRESEQVAFTLHPAERHANNPIVKADKPWEGWRLEIYGNVIYDEEEKIFKMWYNPWSFFPSRLRPWCYAISKDGYRWEKPELGIYSYQGSQNNNILGAYTRSKYFNVFKDNKETDPQKRYKAMGEVEGSERNGTAVAFSPDGLHWTEFAGNPVVLKGRDIADCPTFLGWDPRIQKYVYYPRPGPPLGTRVNGKGFHRPPPGLNLNEGQMRTIGYSTSDDFIRWTPTQLMLAPDQKDRVDFQYYQMTVAQEGEFYIGLMHMLQTHAQTFDIYLLTSRDGFHWNWVNRELPFLGRGEELSYDGGYLTPSAPVLHNDQVWIYYGAYSGAHSAEPSRLGQNRMTIALATLPADRYLGLLAGMDLATLVTRPVVFSGSKLKIDMDASLTGGTASKDPHKRNFDEGDVRIALLDEFGGEIKGFTTEQCKMLAGRSVQEAGWEGGDLASLQGRAVRLRFEYRNAVLYSFQFA